MSKSEFIARVQYNDLVGTAAADQHDYRNIEAWLAHAGHLKPDESLVAVAFFSGEVHKQKQDQPIDCTAYVATTSVINAIDATDASSVVGPCRRIQFEFPLEDFFGLFKRFAIKLSVQGILDGKTIDCVDLE